MAEIVGGLFGVTPEALMAQREQQAREQAMQFAKMGTQQKASYGYSMLGNQLGNAIGGLLGAQDPEMAKAAALQGILKQANPTTPEGLASLAQTLAQQGFGQQAMAAMDQARQAKLNTAKAQTAQNALVRDEALRKELAALGPNATEEDYLKVVMKYGEADKIMAGTQSSLARKDAAEARIEAAKVAAENRLEVARQQGATQLQIAQLAAQSRAEIAQLTASLKQGAKGDAELPPSLQKEEGKDLELIDSLSGQSQALAPALTSLTPDAKGVRKLELGPLKNMKYEAQLAAGNSTPEARAYEALKSAVDTATNLQVSAEKGVQTDKDVLRFAKALTASYGRNDTAATYEALSRYNKAIVDAQERAKGRLESRRKSQGVSAYYEGSTQGPKQNVIKLD